MYASSWALSLPVSDDRCVCHHPTWVGASRFSSSMQGTLVPAGLRGMRWAACAMCVGAPGTCSDDRLQHAGQASPRQIWRAQTPALKERHRGLHALQAHGKQVQGASRAELQACACQPQAEGVGTTTP